MNEDIKFILAIIVTGLIFLGLFQLSINKFKEAKGRDYKIFKEEPRHLYPGWACNNEEDFYVCWKR